MLPTQLCRQGRSPGLERAAPSPPWARRPQPLRREIRAATQPRRSWLAHPGPGPGSCDTACQQILTLRDSGASDRMHPGTGQPLPPRRGPPQTRPPGTRAATSGDHSSASATTKSMLPHPSAIRHVGKAPGSVLSPSSWRTSRTRTAGAGILAVVACDRPACGRPARRDLARAVTRLFRDGPPTATFHSCRPGCQRTRQDPCRRT
jgi:hypothetical protein